VSPATAMRRAVIVTADDFGLTRGVNEAIEQAHNQGILTSTSVLVAGTCAPDVLDVVRRCPDLDIGLHVNLTFGQPICEPTRVRSLVDQEGRFRKDVLRRAALREVRPEEVFREVAAQAGRLATFGVRAGHWDSHQGVAFWPPLVKPIAAACREGGMTSTRSPRAWIIDPPLPPRLARWKHRLVRPGILLTDTAALVARSVLSHYFTMPDWRTSAGFFRPGRASYRSAWEETFVSLPRGVCEIVSHPAHVDDELEQLSPRLVGERAVDLTILSNPDRRSQLETDGVGLMGFRDLIG
jgi:predicted glycoside hydrolase/deacetylase ChbG (UPF0249 family)